MFVCLSIQILIPNIKVTECLYAKAYLIKSNDWAIDDKKVFSKQFYVKLNLKLYKLRVCRLI